MGVGFVGVLRARKNDAVVSVFIESADGGERASVSGDELSRNGLRSGGVDGSVCGSKGRRNATGALGEQHAIVVGICRADRKGPVQGDFRNSQRWGAERHIAQIAQIERRPVGNCVFARSIQRRQGIGGLGGHGGDRLRLGVAASQEIVEVVVHWIAVIDKESDGAGGGNVVVADDGRRLKYAVNECSQRCGTSEKCPAENRITVGIERTS